VTHDPTTTTLLYLHRRYPGEHSFTLALRLQCLVGRELSGAAVKRVLEQLDQQVEAPLRCRAVEVLQQLRLIAAGVADFKLAAPVEYSGGITLKVDGWIIHLVLDGDALALTYRADAPDGRCWVYGCERDDWSLGPDSVIVDPLLLLEQQERDDLLEALRLQPAPALMGVMPMFASRPAAQAEVVPAKRRKRAA
jgi:hypothetical protein